MDKPGSADGAPAQVPIRLAEDPTTDDIPEQQATVAQQPRKRSIAEQRENNRGCIGNGIVLCLLAVVLGSLWMVATDRAGGSTLAEVLDILAPALTGILGAVVGFYFATERIRSE